MHQTREVDVVTGCADADKACFSSQSRSFAGGAGLCIAVAAKLFADGLGICLFVAPLHIGQDALKGMFFDDYLAPIPGVSQGNLLTARAMQQDLLNLLREGFKRGIEIKSVVI